MAAMVALTSPGVRVARADESAASDPQQVERFLAQLPQRSARQPSPATCDAAAKGDRASEMAVAEAIAQMQARIAAMQQPGPQDPSKVAGVMSLNNRGFNYSGGAPLAYQTPPGTPSQ